MNRTSSKCGTITKSITCMQFKYQNEEKEKRYLK